LLISEKTASPQKTGVIRLTDLFQLRAEKTPLAKGPEPKQKLLIPISWAALAVGGNNSGNQQTGNNKQQKSRLCKQT